MAILTSSIWFCTVCIWIQQATFPWLIPSLFLSSTWFWTESQSNDGKVRLTGKKGVSVPQKQVFFCWGLPHQIWLSCQPGNVDLLTLLCTVQTSGEDARQGLALLTWGPNTEDGEWGFLYPLQSIFSTSHQCRGAEAEFRWGKWFTL